MIEKRKLKDIIEYIDEKNKDNIEVFGIMFDTNNKNKKFIEETQLIISNFKNRGRAFLVRDHKVLKTTIEAYGNDLITFCPDTSSNFLYIYPYVINMDILERLNINLSKKKCIISFADMSDIDNSEINLDNIF